MHTETLHNKRGGMASFARLLGLVALMILTASLAGALGAAGLLYAQYVIFAGMLAAAYLLIRRGLTDYRYTLADGTIYFERVVGTRARILESVPMEEAAALLGEGEAAGPADIMRATFLKTGADVLLYRRRGRMYGVAFHPSGKLRGLILEEMNGR